MILEYKGIDIFYSDEGEGNTVLLLHGFLENSNIWKPFIPALSKNNRIICVDLLGHGKTGCLGYVHTMELMAECVEAVISHLNIKKVTLISHSMGGYVSLALAAKDPKKIKGLCLVNSTSQEDSNERKQNRDRAIIAVKQNHKTFIRLAVSNLFGIKNRELYSNEIKQIIDNALQTPLQGIVAAQEGMKTRPNRMNFFRLANFKKAIIISKNDPVLDYKSLINEAEKCRTEAIEFSGGHMSFIENERCFLLKIMYFIENI